jgi:hypothetical protein
MTSRTITTLAVLALCAGGTYRPTSSNLAILASARNRRPGLSLPTGVPPPPVLPIEMYICGKLARGADGAVQVRPDSRIDSILER